MPNVLKFLRSITPGARPSGRVYGEMYVNFGDNQIGAFDSGNNARDLIGVPMFSSAATYPVGYAVNYQGQVYISLAAVPAGVWNPAQWSPIVSQSALAKNRFGGQLTYVDATHLAFKPFQGSNIIINGASYPIPAAGIVGLTTTGVFVNGVAGQNLANSTIYNVYCFNNAGVLTADFSTTTHVTSITPGNLGVEIKSGDDTRSLIGKVFLGSGNFYDAPVNRLVISWFNRNKKFVQAAASGGAGVGSSAVPVGGSAGFLTWANQSITLLIGAGQVVPTSDWGTVYVYTGLDGAILGITNAASGISNVGLACGAVTPTTPSEGYHYIQVFASAVAGSGAYIYQQIQTEILG